jgi:hypothetical protein
VRRHAAAEAYRRGVTPFVLFWNFCGKISENSEKSCFLMMSEWIAATPLTADE